MAAAVTGTGTPQLCKPEQPGTLNQGSIQGFFKGIYKASFKEIYKAKGSFKGLEPALRGQFQHVSASELLWRISPSWRLAQRTQALGCKDQGIYEF